MQFYSAILDTRQSKCPIRLCDVERQVVRDKKWILMIFHSINMLNIEVKFASTHYKILAIRARIIHSTHKTPDIVNLCKLNANIESI